MAYRTLVIQKIGKIFENHFGYPSRKIYLYDPVSRLTKAIYIHQRHAGHQSIWYQIERFGDKCELQGEIKLIALNPELIKSIRSYKNARINWYAPHGTFVIINYQELNTNGNLQIALRDQLYQYIKADGVTFDPDELFENEFLKDPKEKLFSE